MAGWEPFFPWLRACLSLERVTLVGDCRSHKGDSVRSHRTYTAACTRRLRTAYLAVRASVRPRSGYGSVSFRAGSFPFLSVPVGRNLGRRGAASGGIPTLPWRCVSSTQPSKMIACMPHAGPSERSVDPWVQDAGSGLSRADLGALRASRRAVMMKAGDLLPSSDRYLRSDRFPIFESESRSIPA